MKMKKWTFLIFLGFLATSALSQPRPVALDKAAESDRPLALAVDSAIKTQVKGKPLAKFSCDEDGNAYLRLYILEKAVDGTAFQVPIQEIKADGSLGPSFKVTDAQSDFSAADFVVSPDGDLFELAWNPKQDLYVLSFGSDGSFKSKTKIEAPFFTVYQFAVFKSGEFLLSGTDGERQHTAYTAVFNSSGKLVKKVDAEEDQRLTKAAQSGDSNFISQATGGAGNSAVEQGEAVAASDGNVYVLRSTSPALVHVISPSGEIIRELKIEPGDPALFPTGIKIAKGRVAVVFHRGRSSTSVDGVMKVTDLEGNPLSEYALTDSWSAGPIACYTPSGFTFVNTKQDGFVYLFKASPK